MNLIVRAFWAFVAPLRMPLRYYNRATRRLMGYKSPIALGYHLQPIAGGATIVGTRSPLFYKQVAGGLPAILDGTIYTGNIFYVDSAVGTDSAGYGTTPDAPLATIDYAIGLCTANQGDRIIVLPGHAETTTAITVDKAGISIVGLGVGATRPAITGDAVADVITITAANILVANLRFATPSAAVTALINVAATRVTVRGCVFELGANIVDAVTITAAGELVTLEDNEVIVSANGPDSWLKFEGVVDRPVVVRNKVIGSDGTNAFDDGVIDFDSVAVTNALVAWNHFTGADVVTTVIANGGSVVGANYGPNYYGGSATDADNSPTLAAGSITASTIAANAIGASEIATGAIDADSLAADALQAIQDEAQDAIQGEQLDHLVALTDGAGAALLTVVDGSIISKIVSKVSGGDTSSYDNTTDSLEMVSDKFGAFSGDGGAAQDDSVKASLDLAHTDLDTILTNLTTIDDFLDTEIAAILVDTGTDGVVIGADAITSAKIADNAFATEHFAASAGEKTTDGIIVTRATAALPQSTSGDIFTVTGVCLVKRILGYVTVAVGNIPNATKIKVNSTGAGATTDICGTNDIDNDAADTRYEITGTFANAMVATLDIPAAPSQATEIVVPPGTIMVDCAGSDGGGGRVKWSVTYVPMEAGASIVAA